MLVGYARVSTRQQDTALQRAAFKRAGVRVVLEEKQSAGKRRPVLEQLLDELQPGQTVVVYKTDRLARSIADLLRILERIQQAGASFRSLTEPFETTTAAGRMLLQMLGVVAEFERAVIRERCEAGRQAARARGVRFGPAPKLDVERVRPLVESGLAQFEVAKALGVPRSTVAGCARRHGLQFLLDGRGRRSR